MRSIISHDCYATVTLCKFNVLAFICMTWGVNLTIQRSTASAHSVGGVNNDRANVINIWTNQFQLLNQLFFRVYDHKIAICNAHSTNVTHILFALMRTVRLSAVSQDSIVSTQWSWALILILPRHRSRRSRNYAVGRDLCDDYNLLFNINLHPHTENQHRKRHLM